MNLFSLKKQKLKNKTKSPVTTTLVLPYLPKDSQFFALVA